MSDILKNPFRLIGTRAIDIIFNGDKAAFTDNYILDFDYSILQPEEFISEEEKRMFVIEFDARISEHGSTAPFFVTKYHVTFQSELPFTKEYLDTPGIKINCPAIAFPFLRAFVTTVSANAGYPPIMLPSINFVKMAASQELKKKGSAELPD